MNRKMLTVMVAVMLLLATTLMAAESPIDKGSVILGGSASYASYGGDLYTDLAGDGFSIVTFAPSVGYFVAPSIEIGALIMYQSFSGGGETFSQSTFGPEFGYFFKTGDRTEVKGSMYPYIKAFALFSSSEGDKQTSIGGKGGFDFMLSNAVALDAGVTFQSDSYKPDGSTESTTGSVLMIGAGISAFIF